jgi:hypothetical protein
MLYGDAAKPAALATLRDSGSSSSAAESGAASAARRPRTPLEEYAASIDAALAQIEVTPGLEGRTFAAAARVAFLRYGVTVIAATVPVNEEVAALVSGLPRTYRVQVITGVSARKCTLLTLV